MNIESKELKKSLHPTHLWAIAVGLVISGDYFGWSYGYKSGVGGFFIAVCLVTIFYITFAFSFTELSTAIPNAGGPFAYAQRALGNTGGFLAAFATLVEFLLAAPAIASALGSYLHFLFPSIHPIYSALTFLALFTYINLRGVQQTANFELVITVLASIGIIVYLSLIVPHSSPGYVFQKIPEATMNSVFTAIPFAIWFYLAVEGVAMSAEETENPKRDIPRGYGLGIGTLVIFALSVMIFTSGLKIESGLWETDHPLAQALQGIYGVDSWIAKGFGLFGLIGLMASLLGIILGYSRQIYAVSRAGFLPQFLSKINEETGVPKWACISGSLFGAFFILLGVTDEMITLSVLGAIIMYTVSMISLFVLRFKEPELERPFTAPFYPFFPALALCLAVLCLFAVGYSYPKMAILFFAGLLINLILFLLTKGRRNV